MATIINLSDVRSGNQDINPTFPPEGQNREQRRHGSRAVNKHEVLFALGISSPTLYRLIQKGLFPKPIKIGSKASRWLESDIQEYLDKVSAERNADQGGQS